MQTNNNGAQLNFEIGMCSKLRQFIQWKLKDHIVDMRIHQKMKIHGHI